MAPLVVAIVFLYQTIAILPAVADHAAGFPGTGDYQTWRKASAVYNQGYEFAEARNYSGAISKYQAAISIYPHDADYFVALGDAYLKRELSGDSQKAESAFRRAIALRSKFWNAWYGLANVLFDQKRYSESKAALTKASSCNPTDEQLKTVRNNMAEIDRKLASNK